MLLVWPTSLIGFWIIITIDLLLFPFHESPSMSQLTLSFSSSWSTRGNTHYNHQFFRWSSNMVWHICWGRLVTHLLFSICFPLISMDDDISSGRGTNIFIFGSGICRWSFSQNFNPSYQYVKSLRKFEKWLSHLCMWRIFMSIIP